MQKQHLIVNWKFLFATLHKFEFGESFIRIRALYTSATATVTTNGLISHKFTLHNRTRQGCPLSPSLFALIIEPLAAAIRQNEIIKGTQLQSLLSTKSSFMHMFYNSFKTHIQTYRNLIG